MIKAINQSSDAEFVTAVSEYLDLKQFLSHVAVERFIGEQDGIVGGVGLNNFFLYRFEKKNLSQFIAWDKDITFASEPEESIWRHINDVPAEQENRPHAPGFKGTRTETPTCPCWPLRLRCGRRRRIPSSRG